jgi:hypothetical protein
MYIADRIRARPPGAGRGSKEFLNSPRTHCSQPQRLAAY